MELHLGRWGHQKSFSNSVIKLNLTNQLACRKFSDEDHKKDSKTHFRKHTNFFSKSIKKSMNFTKKELLKEELCFTIHLEKVSCWGTCRGTSFLDVCIFLFARKIKSNLLKEEEFDVWRIRSAATCQVRSFLCVWDEIVFFWWQWCVSKWRHGPGSKLFEVSGQVLKKKVLFSSASDWDMWFGLLWLSAKCCPPTLILSI